MDEREKVIKGLECCARRNVGDCVNCPYDDWGFDCDVVMMTDALELLEVREQCVMTLEELEALPDGEEYNAPVCLENKFPVTTWDGGTRCRWVGARLVKEDYLDDNEFFNRGTYGKTWRAWTDWPGTAKREAVKWE